MRTHPFDYTVYSPLFEKYRISAAGVERLQWAWLEPHRYYHTEKHLAFLIGRIEQSPVAGDEKDKLLLTAFFHDIVYDPTAHDNEERSVAMLREITQHAVVGEVAAMIMDTKTHQPRTELSRRFVEYDMAVVSESGFGQLLAWEYGVFKEFRFVDYSLYKAGRLALLDGWAKQYPQNGQNLHCLMATTPNTSMPKPPASSITSTQFWCSSPCVFWIGFWCPNCSRVKSGFGLFGRYYFYSPSFFGSHVSFRLRHWQFVRQGIGH